MKFTVGEAHPNWRGGSDPNRGAEWVKLSDQIRVRDCRECCRCFKTEQANGQRLSVDHIIPWRLLTDKAVANDPRNLASLCRSCHSLKLKYERKLLRGDVLALKEYLAFLDVKQDLSWVMEQLRVRA